MSNVKSDINFVKFGLDSDTNLKYMEIGSAPEHYNVLIAEDNNNGVLSNLKGNKHIPLPTTISLNNSYVYVTVGSYYNELTRSVYYFIFSLPYDSDGSGEYLYDNYLLRYNEDDSTIDLIFHDTKNYFGLHKDYLMRDCRMIGTWLYFNPKISEPKMIDVDMAYNYSNYDVWSEYLEYNYGDKITYYGGLFYAVGAVTYGESPVTNPELWTRIGDSYQDETGLSFDSEFDYAFNVIKMAPVALPYLSSGSDRNIYSNNVRGKMFRFAYRYKYFDNSYSVYSAYSDVSLPTDDETWNGEILDDVNSNNYIAVTISLHSSALIKEAEIIFQEIGGNWKRCKIINRREQELISIEPPNFTYNFYNNEAYEIITLELVTKTYDTVPRTAQTTEIINKNVLCYGQCLEGFDNLNKDEIDVTLTPSPEDIEMVPDVGAVLRDNLASNDLDWVMQSHPGSILLDYFYRIDVSGYLTWGLAAGSRYRIVVEGVEGVVTLTNDDLLNVTAFLDAIGEAVRTNNAWIYKDWAGERLWIGKFWGLPSISVSMFFTSAGSSVSLTKKHGFKTGAFHPFCQFYYDENLRRWDAQTSKESVVSTGLTYEGTTVYVPMLGEYSPTPTDTALRWTIDWTVNHLPPIGAKYWRWGYAGNSLCSYFVQYIIEDISNPGDDTTVIDITPLQTLKDAEAGWNSFPHSNIDPYVWQKGDRIRFITSQGIPGTGTIGAVIDGVYDFEIIGQSEDTYSVYIQEWTDYNAVGIDVELNSIVEIYRPIRSDNKIEFYEFGPLMPIIEDADGYTVHGGLDQDQEYLTATEATGTFNVGDIYHLYRTPSKVLSDADNELGVFMESQWYSDFYDSDDWSKGKAGEETSYNERELNIIRYSHQYLQDTQINGLSTFDGGRYKELNDTYGEIMGIEEVGDTLKVYQEKKPSSIQLGRIERSDETGKISISLSSDVLGSIRYSTTRWGTEFRESIIRNNRYVYGFDIYNGVMWRDSANGIFPISGRYSDVDGDRDYKMATYFKNKAKALLESGVDYIDVVTAWDEEFDLLYVTFHDYVNSDNNETIVFHEPSNRWICFAEHNRTEEYNSILELDYSIVNGFNGGIGYSFNEEDRFAYFNITTSVTPFIFLGLKDLEIRPFSLSISASSQFDADVLELEISPVDPTIVCTSVNGSVTTMDFESAEEGFVDNKTTVITVVDSAATILGDTPVCSIYQIPTWYYAEWIVVMNSVGDVCKEGDEIEDGETLYVYPKAENLTSNEKSGNLILKTAKGDTLTVAITQAAYSATSNVTLSVAPASADEMTLTYLGGYNIDGTANVYVSFIPDHISYGDGQSFGVRWSATKNGDAAGGGYITIYNEVHNMDVLIELNTTARTTDDIAIYLRSIIQIE